MKTKETPYSYKFFFLLFLVVVVFCLTLTYIDIYGPLITFIKKKGLHVSIPIFLLIAFISWSITYNMTSFYKKHLDEWEKADAEELFREDRILLSLVGLSQATLFILFNNFLLEMHEFTSLVIRVSIVIMTSVFSFLRGYAHIKNSPYWRHQSMKILLVIILWEMPAIIWGTILRLIGAVIIWGVDITFIISNPFSLTLIFLFDRISRAFKNRYYFSEVIE